eukprot:TRINITY_DN11312_c0_g1_i4.p3 TRINITY_DN11312_c0_g1~~TRINITY_DN11312_c0_g1_i4.p3  ORF type:complete len:195 (-),score=64.77 TRINITY_DN11312_c0_g1_i4:764-1288(-)
MCIRDRYTGATISIVLSDIFEKFGDSVDQLSSLTLLGFTDGIIHMNEVRNKLDPEGYWSVTMRNEGDFVVIEENGSDCEEFGDDTEEEKVIESLNMPLSVSHSKIEESKAWDSSMQLIDHSVNGLKGNATINANRKESEIPSKGDEDKEALAQKNIEDSQGLGRQEAEGCFEDL